MFNVSRPTGRHNERVVRTVFKSLEKVRVFHARTRGTFYWLVFLLGRYLQKWFAGLPILLVLLWVVVQQFPISPQSFLVCAAILYGYPRFTRWTTTTRFKADISPTGTWLVMMDGSIVKCNVFDREHFYIIMTGRGCVFRFAKGTRVAVPGMDFDVVLTDEPTEKTVQEFVDLLARLSSLHASERVRFVNDGVRVDAVTRTLYRDEAVSSVAILPRHAGRRGDTG